MSIYNFDASTDYSGKELYAILSTADLPDYVKTAELDDVSDLRGLNKAAFADPDRRIYPINTPARVYVSNAYFMNKQAAITKTYGQAYSDMLLSKIAEAADILDISEDLESYNSRLNEKQAADYAEQYMVDFNIDGMDAPVQLYPVKTAADLEKAAEDFTKNIKNFPFSIRVKSAETFVKAAEELQVDDMPELLMKYAGMYYPDLHEIGDELWRRSTKLKKQAHVDIYNSIINDLENMSNLSEVMKIAETCFNIENMEGLYDNVKVASILGDPVDCFFTKQIEKVAQDLNYVEVHGDKYKLSDLTKISKDQYEEAFGDCGIDPADPEKIADILPTMPRSDVKLLEEITGLRPV
jgi:hypothetical protein